MKRKPKYKKFVKFMNGYNQSHKTSGFQHTGTLITQPRNTIHKKRKIKSYLADNYRKNVISLNLEQKSLMEELKRKSFYESSVKYESPTKLAFIEKMRKKYCKFLYHYCFF